MWVAACFPYCPFNSDSLAFLLILSIYSEDAVGFAHEVLCIYDRSGNLNCNPVQQQAFHILQTVY